MTFMAFIRGNCKQNATAQEKVLVVGAFFSDCVQSNFVDTLLYTRRPGGGGPHPAPHRLQPPQALGRLGGDPQL